MKTEMRVLLQREGLPDVECWEWSQDDRVLGYYSDAGDLISEPVPGLQTLYIPHGDDPARTVYPVQ